MNMAYGFLPNTQFQDVFGSEQNRGFYSRADSLHWGCGQSEQPGVVWGVSALWFPWLWLSLRFDVLLVILSSSWGSPEKVLSLCSGTEEAPFVQMHTSYPLTRVASTVCLYLTDCICVVSTRVPKNSWRLWPWIITGTRNTYCGSTVLHPITDVFEGCFPGREEWL